MPGARRNRVSPVGVPPPAPIEPPKGLLSDPHEWINAYPNAKPKTDAELEAIGAEPADTLPPKPPDLPSLADEAMRHAREAALRRARGSAGASSTFLTGPKGLGPLLTLANPGLIGR